MTTVNLTNFNALLDERIAGSGLGSVFGKAEILSAILTPVQTAITALDAADTALAASIAAGIAASVPTTRTVNGHALSANVTVTKADVGLTTVEDTALSTWVGSAAITTLGTIATGTWHGGVIAALYGGTGLAAYAVGDLLYASGAAALSKLAAVAVGSVLVSGGVTTAPAWSASPTLTSVTIAAAGKYGFAGSGAGIEFNGTMLQFKAPDNGAYVYFGNGSMYVNSAYLAMANGGSPLWVWSGVTADGKLSFTNGTGATGAGFDVTTDALLKIRTRAQTGYATIDVLGLKASGVAGASKAAGPVTSITVVNGIVTACT